MVPVSDSDLVLVVVSESVGVSEVCHWVSWVSEQVEAVELGLALDGDLALPLAVIIELQKLHLKALISIVRVKAIVNHQLTTQRLPPLRRLFVLKSKYLSLRFCVKSSVRTFFHIYLSTMVLLIHLSRIPATSCTVLPC
ncbi:hypothetical protein C5167_010692 [Papaver somniferum]|uniref:Uncharacterized protein n=1 Tax=Papaver somniferum TaxID=3469 RepID=A0A4Y7K0Y0_PAPSO|nr:hypothetical protein C5167_010692 [Papaver somniferum]